MGQTGTVWHSFCQFAKVHSKSVLGLLDIEWPSAELQQEFVDSFPAELHLGQAGTVSHSMKQLVEVPAQFWLGQQGIVWPSALLQQEFLCNFLQNPIWVRQA